MKETIGERVRRLRHEQGLSQADLVAGVAGISTAHISRIETGSRTPSRKVLRKIARRLGVQAEELEFGKSSSIGVLREDNRRLRAENLKLAATLATVMGELAELKARTLKMAA